jgi:hypothetical protein
LLCVNICTIVDLAPIAFPQTGCYWFNSAPLGASIIQFQHEQSDGEMFTITMSSDATISLGDSGNTYLYVQLFTGALRDSTWHHICWVKQRSSGTFMNGDWSLYIDGEWRQGATVTQSTGTPDGTTGNYWNFAACSVSDFR